MSKWTDKDIEYLKDNYGKQSYEAIGIALGKTASSVQHKAERIGLVTSNRWTEDELSYLKQNYSDCTAKEIADSIGKSQGTVEQMARKLGLRKREVDMEKKLKESAKGLESRRPWTQKEVKLLQAMAPDYSYKEIADTLDRTEHSVAMKANRLGIVKEEKKPNWSMQELDYIRTSYAKAKVSDLLKNLPRRDINAIYNKAYELGLKRETKLLGNTKPEVIFEGLLKSKGIHYIPQARVYNRYYKIDFLVNGSLAVEVHGDFWHCNPVIYPDGPFCSIQEVNVEKDIKKHEYLRSLGYKVLVLWESDLYDNPEDCINKVLSELPS